MSSTMREALVHAGPLVSVITSPIPTPGPSQLLLKVHYAASNPKDWKRPTLMGAAPANQGDDVAGTIAALGADVVGWSVGDRVAALHTPGAPHGSYAEYCVVEASAAWRVPEGRSMAEAATVSLAAMTAAVALWRELNAPWPWAVAEREPIVIYGAGSGVGAFGVQFARLSGLGPIIAVAGAGGEYVKGLLDTERGDAVVDYRNGVEETIEAVNRALGGRKARLGLDAVSVGSSARVLSSVLEKESGTARIATVLPLNAVDEVEKIRRSFTISPLVFADAKEEGVPKNANRWLGLTIIKVVEMAFADGSLKGHPFEVVEGGLEGIETGLRKLQKGSSGGPVKYVYQIGE